MQGANGKGLMVKTQAGQAHAADLVMLVSLLHCAAAERVRRLMRRQQQICLNGPLSQSPPQVIGVRPEVGLAKEAGLELGARGGIKVWDSSGFRRLKLARAVHGIPPCLLPCRMLSCLQGATCPSHLTPAATPLTMCGRWTMACAPATPTSGLWETRWRCR